MSVDWVAELQHLLGAEGTLSGDAVGCDWSHDEALSAPWATPLAVAIPNDRGQVNSIVEIASRERVSIVPRGSGTGLSGGANASATSMVLSTSKLNRILDINERDLIAEVEAGVTLAQLDEALAGIDLLYPVYPGEMGATIGGNLATNAGGMRAVRYGTTRNNVAGLDFVDGYAATVAAGGRFSKSSSGYDLSQLFIGSEGTLGIAVRALLRIQRRPRFSRSILILFPDVDAASETARDVLAAGCKPEILEYLEPQTFLLMASTVKASVPENQIAGARCLLLIELKGFDEATVDRELLMLENAVSKGSATEIFELPPKAAQDVLRAREAAFWVAKSAGAREIVDSAIPPSRFGSFLAEARQIAADHRVEIAAAGHLGDGNVHLSLFAPKLHPAKKAAAEIVQLAAEFGGAVSGEHGIGLAKQSEFLSNLDERSYRIMRAIKQVFDPVGIMNPGKVLP